MRYCAIVALTRYLVTTFTLVPQFGEFESPLRTSFLLTAAVEGVMAGVVWVYASEIAGIIVGLRRRAVESGSRTAALVFLLASLPGTVGDAYLWLAEPETAKQYSAIVFELVPTKESTIGSFIAMGLCVLVFLLAAPIDCSITRAERVRELRREGE